MANNLFAFRACNFSLVKFSMDPETKNPDSANESIESFEDAIDHLEISDDPKITLKSDDPNQLSRLTSNAGDIKENTSITSPNTDPVHTPSDTNSSDKLKTSEPPVSSDTDIVTTPTTDRNSSNKDESTEPPVTKPLTDTNTSKDRITEPPIKSNTDTTLKTNDGISNTMSESDSNSPNVEINHEEKCKIISSETITTSNPTSEIEIKETVQNTVESITTNLTGISLIETKIDQRIASEISLKEDCNAPTEIKKETIPPEPSNPVKPTELAKDLKLPEPVKDEPLKGDVQNELPDFVKDLPTETLKSVVENEVTHSEISTNASLEYEKPLKIDNNSTGTRPESLDESINHKSEGELDDTLEGSVNSEERECGDGQGEQDDDSKKELDHDEDRRNPEYIPKKGSFYEHDTRTMDGYVFFL